MNNNTFNSNNPMYTNTQVPKKKKKYWLIPLITFLLMVFFMILPLIIFEVTNTEVSKEVNQLFTTMYLICGLLFWPNVIIAIVLSVKQKKNL